MDREFHDIRLELLYPPLISRVKVINGCWIISLMFRALGRSIIYYAVSIKSLQGVNNR